MQNLFQTLQKYLTPILLVVIIVLTLFLQKSCNSVKQLSSIYAEASDSLHKTVNKLGQEQTTTLALIGSVSDLKKLNSSKDSAIKKLQQIVDKNTYNATVLASKTTSSSTSATVIYSKPLINNQTVRHDTIIDSVLVYPTYKTITKSRWDSVSAVANKDSFNINYTVYNEFDLKTEWQSQGLFKPKKCVASVLNNNPKTKTLEFKTFEFEAPKHRRWTDWLIGAGAATVLFLIAK